MTDSFGRRKMSVFQNPGTFTKRKEIILYLGEDAMWVTIERFGSPVNLVLVSASVTRPPLKFSSALKYRVTPNNQKMVVLFNLFEIE